MTDSAFTKWGYEIIRDVFSRQEVGELREEARRLACEEGAACVRQIGQKSARLQALSCDPRLLKLLPRPLRMVRGILFDKTPAQNWPVLWHQDLTIAVRERHEDSAGFGPWSVKNGVPHVQPPRTLLEQMATLRIHLDDTPAENGALRVMPGSHTLGRLDPADAGQYVRETATVTCACAAGDVLLMRPLLLHASRRSTHPGHRRVLHFEYAPGEALPAPLQWFEDGPA